MKSSLRSLNDWRLQNDTFTVQREQKRGSWMSACMCGALQQLVTWHVRLVWALSKSSARQRQMHLILFCVAKIQFVLQPSASLPSPSCFHYLGIFASLPSCGAVWFLFFLWSAVWNDPSYLTVTLFSFFYTSLFSLVKTLVVTLLWHTSLSGLSSYILLIFQSLASCP